MPRKPMGDNDIERGRRFSKILDKIFPGMSRRAASEALGLHHSRVANMEGGSSIDNKILGFIGDREGGADDLVWLLTGHRAAGSEDAAAVSPSQILAIKILSDMMEAERVAIDQSGERLAILFECLRGVALDASCAEKFIEDRDVDAFASVLRPASSKRRRQSDSDRLRQ